MLADQQRHAVGLRERLDARSEVDRITDHCCFHPVWTTHRLHHREAHVQADPDLASTKSIDSVYYYLNPAQGESSLLILIGRELIKPVGIFQERLEILMGTGSKCQERREGERLE